MKRLPLSFLFLSLSAITYGQGFYFRTGLGYGFAQAGQTLYGNGEIYNGTVNNATNEYKIKGASFGAGVQGYAGLGYMFSKHVGTDIAANIGVLPRKYKATISNVTLGAGVPGEIRIEQQAILPLIIEPSIVVQNGGDKWNIYSRLGVAIPINTKIMRDQIQTNAPGTGAINVDDFTSVIKSRFSLGFTGAAGVQYKLNSRMSLWGEFSILSLSVYTKQSKLVAFTENGQSYPLTQVSGNQTINYSKSGVLDNTGANQASYSQPFSNVGINVGISISFSKKGRSANSEGVNNKSRRPAPAKFQ